MSGTTSSPSAEKDVMFVAFGKDVKESETILKWALQNYEGGTICVLHVHQPAKKMPMMGANVSISLMEETKVEAYHENERQEMQKLLDKYIRTCEAAGVRAVKLCVEMDSIEKGIVHLIFEHRIKRLVMGAAANKSCSRKMKEPKSKKAIHVSREAPMFCQIWFVCKGTLICTRESKSSGVEIEAVSPSLDASLNTETMQSLRSLSVKEIVNVQNYSRVRNDNVFAGLSSQSSLSHWDSLSARSPTSGIIESLVLQPSNVDRHHSSVSDIERSMNDELYDRLEQFVAEAESSRREVYEESIRRKKAEKDVIDALHRVKVTETMYASELRLQRELEEELGRDREEVEKMKWQLDEVMEKLRVVHERKSSMEFQISNSEKMVEELEQKMFSAIDLLNKYKKERDELQFERDDALRDAEELRKNQVKEASSSSVSQSVPEFSLLEIREGTRNFSESLKMGEGRYGSVYRGKLRHTQVAIKMVNRNSLKGPVEFQQEVNMLNKLRHPNIVSLIGACSEAYTLIYEYIPNGSLEDRLNCKENTPPLSWQTRIRIATELCSVLIYLHSGCRPRIVHGDVNPEKILINANLVSKLSGFRMHNVSEEELTSNSDMYSFGIIILRLLTGRPAVDIIDQVRDALEKGKLKDVLDASAGEWPFVQTKELAYVAMRCCDLKYRLHPDLASEVWRVLEPMRVSSFRDGSEVRQD